jgi:hypothetical protein
MKIKFNKKKIKNKINRNKKKRIKFDKKNIKNQMSMDEIEK